MKNTKVMKALTKAEMEVMNVPKRVSWEGTIYFAASNSACY
jgi:hypothetical protein